MKETSPTPLYVIGHRNPDTDSICSAIGNAAFLREDGEFPDAIPARCGHMPRRTEWVLEQAGIPKPVYIRDVHPTVATVCRRDVICVTPNHTFLDTYKIMEENAVRSIPVVSEEGYVLGMLQFLDLLRLLMPSELTEYSLMRNVETNFLCIRNTLEAENITQTDLGEEDEELIVVVAASSELTLWRRLERYKNEGQINRVLLVCGDRDTVQRYAVELGVRALVITANYAPPAEIVQMAREHGTIIFLTKFDTASVGKLVRCSRRVKHVLRHEFESFEEDVRLDDIKHKVARLRQDLFPVIDPVTKKLSGVFSKSDLVNPPRVRLALVDHNEIAQAVPGIEDADVIEVLDHHRLGGSISSRNPIRFLAEPVGSTSTLVARRFFHRNRLPEKGVALCLCAGILSDTINLTSPTTTDLDRRVLERLCEIAEVEPGKFIADFFAAGSMLRSGENPKAILNMDRKEFEEYGQKISISQIEEVGMEGFEEARPGLEAILKEMIQDHKYNLACLLITDVSSHDSLLLVAGDAVLIDEIPYKKIDDTLYEATGVVSRKKQLFPDLANALRRAGGL